MLPAVTALVHASPSGVVGWGVRSGVDPLLIGSVLHRLNSEWVDPSTLPYLRFPEEETANWSGRSGAQAILRLL